MGTVDDIELAKAAVNSQMHGSSRIDASTISAVPYVLVVLLHARSISDMPADYLMTHPHSQNTSCRAVY